MNPARKITKAVYQIVEKFHRLYGLELYLFSGPHGAGYVGFQVAASRCYGERSVDLNYGYMHPEGECLSLVTYLCGPVALPDWSTTKKAELPDWERRRSREIESWLLENLTLEPLFSRFSNEIKRWRQTYTVEESEKYLSLLNVAGLISQHSGEMLLSAYQCFSDYDPKGYDKGTGILSQLGVERSIDAVGIRDCMLSRSGNALIGDTFFDFWGARLRGDTPEKIAEWLWSLTCEYRNRPK